MDVVFRVDKKTKEVFALFPHDVCNNQGHVTSYQHIGQHSQANYRYCIGQSKKATKREYMPLKKELVSVGYKTLNVISRQNYDKWLDSYKHLN